MDITIRRTATVAEIAPGDTIEHPETGEPFALEHLGLGLDSVVTLTGRHPARPSRRHKVKVENFDEVQVLPTERQAAQVWEAIAGAVAHAVEYWLAVATTSDPAAPADALQAAPWEVRQGNGELPRLEVTAGGHRWAIAAALAAGAEPAADTGPGGAPGSDPVPASEG